MKNIIRIILELFDNDYQIRRAVASRREMTLEPETGGRRNYI